MKNKSTYNYVEDYLTEIQSKGRYSLTLNELQTKFDTSEKAILQKIYRLKNKNKLAQVRKEFYVIIPPQYSNRGMVPPTLFINDMMDFLNRKYYVGLFSAAALHGAGHQQPMEFQIVTQKPALRNINNQKLAISFFTKSEWEMDQIIEKKTETGYLKVSSPEKTAFDMVQYHKRIGGLNRILPILEDLTETIKPSLLSKTAKTQKKTNIQRLGFLLDKLGSKSLASSLFRLLGKDLKELPLSLAHKERTGTINEKWKIIENTELDF
ncbi:MAG: type IV toxin-antitoxin system AbiEi family antitoxin [Bacteroidales bacterium]|nr:type IV toxin-antitoxin system AbiEi family antitoxin [Bacteroidales bacterium]